MKKLKLNLLQFEGAEVLTRSQLKKILGGDSGSGGPCNLNCSGYRWNPTTLKYDYGTAKCEYFPPLGHLPGGSSCPFPEKATEC